MQDFTRVLAGSCRRCSPGGILCFRDYGVFDLAQLRVPETSVITPQLHFRGDGTLAYYFRKFVVLMYTVGVGFIRTYESYKRLPLIH